MVELIVEFESDKFSVFGNNWTIRVKPFRQVPNCHLLLDAMVKQKDGKQTPVQLFCVKDENGLRCDGDWQLAPRIA